MGLTNSDAIELFNKAIHVKHVLTIKCPNGDIITTCKNKIVRWGKSRWAEPSGKTIHEEIHPCKNTIANIVIQHCGRGNVAKAARKILPL